MTTFAVVEGDRVINRILAEDKETAESVTGKTCIECDGTSMIGGTYQDGVFGPGLSSDELVSEDLPITEV